jgi:hypothetical protein
MECNKTEFAGMPENSDFTLEFNALTCITSGKIPFEKTRINCVD